MINILIVEDEPPIANLIKLSLVKAGYLCECVNDGLEAAYRIETNKQYDLILLDVMLPGLNGFELMETILPTGIPVIFITAKNAVADRVKGLKIGAEDYIVKPFEVVELLARVEVILRRYNKIASQVCLGDIVVDTRAMTVKRGDTEYRLTNKEYELLLLFMRNPGMALSRDTIYSRVWGGEYNINSRTVDLHVQRIRKKLGLNSVLKSVHGIGYCLEV